MKAFSGQLVGGNGGVGMTKTGRRVWGKKKSKANRRGSHLASSIERPGHYVLRGPENQEENEFSLINSNCLNSYWIRKGGGDWKAISFEGVVERVWTSPGKKGILIGNEPLTWSENSE